MFVGGLDKSVTQEQLGRYFSQFAAVTSVKIIGFQVNASRGFGFVEFLS